MPKLPFYLPIVLTCSVAANADPPAKPASSEPTASTPVSIAVFISPEISDSVVRQMIAETEAIWRPAGLTFTWQEVAGRGTARASQIDVSIDERVSGPADIRTTLGWITFTGGRPDPSIHLSRAAAEALLAGLGRFTDPPLVGHDVLIGRALGRALSHELGHLFLKSRSHAARGLMRAAWPPQELFAFRRRGFQLSTEERNAAARGLQEDFGGGDGTHRKPRVCKKATMNRMPSMPSGTAAWASTAGMRDWPYRTARVDT